MLISNAGKMMQDKLVLVIGGAGFVGSHLVDYLLNSGAIVHCLDNFFTGSLENISPDCVIHNCNSADINLIEFGCSFDFVFHLGEYSRVEQSYLDIDLVFEYNHNSIYGILKFVKSHNAKLIYSGSSTKFGDYKEKEMLSPYAWTKLKNVDLIIHYAHWHQIEFAITYFYNVYGPRELAVGNYATLIGKYLNLVKSGVVELPVVLPGSQIRNFTHVQDIVSGLVLVALKGSGDGHGIGAGEGYSILDVVEMLGCSPVFIESRKGNRLSASVHTEKILTLGWNQEKNLLDYLSGVNS